MSGKGGNRKTVRQRSTRVSLAPLPPDEAVAGLLKVKPEPRAKRQGKQPRKARPARA